MNYEIEFDNALNEMESWGMKYAEFRSLREQLERQTDNLFSKLFLESSAKTIAEKEHIASASEQYLAHLKGLKEAQLEEIRAKVKYEKSIAKFDSLKCLCSRDTALIKTTGGV